MALSEITPSLFLSGSDGAQNGPLVSRKGITLIVNATLAHPSLPLPGVEVLRVPVSDLPSAPLHQHFDRVAERIHGNSGKTLVHCAAGMSRSPALVMAYLMRFRGVSLQQAHAFVRERRPHIRLNRGFWQQLLTYERRLYGSNSVRLAEDTDEGGMSTTTQSLGQLRPQQLRPQPGHSPAMATRGHQLLSLRSPLTSDLRPSLTSTLSSLRPSPSPLLSRRGSLSSAPLSPRLRGADLVSHRTRSLGQVPPSPPPRRRK